MHACLLAQLCPVLWDPMDCIPPGSSIHQISQASILESAAIPFSWGSSQPRDWTRVFCIGRQILYCLRHQGSPCMYTQSLHLCPNLCDSMDGSLQASLSMGFSQQEYWSELPSRPPGDLPDPGIESTSLAFPALQMDSLLMSPRGSPGKPSHLQILMVTKLASHHLHQPQPRSRQRKFSYICLCSTLSTAQLLQAISFLAPKRVRKDKFR